MNIQSVPLALCHWWGRYALRYRLSLTGFIACLVFLSDTNTCVIAAHDVDSPSNGSPSGASQEQSEQLQEEAATPAEGHPDPASATSNETIGQRIESKLNCKWSSSTSGGVSFSQFVTLLAKEVGHQVRIDTESTSFVGVFSETEMEVNGSGRSAGSVLRETLGKHSLSYYVTEQELVITSLEEAQKTTITRVYCVPYFNLVAPGTPPSSVTSTRHIIDVIQSMIAPESWSKTGGGRSIRAFTIGEGSPKTQIVIVAQTYEVHLEIQSLLDALGKNRTPITD